MNRKKDPASRRLPVLGWRIIKTAIAVFICLVIYLIRGYSGADMPTEAPITAIMCMQPYLRDSKTFALNRVAGTLVGTFWGLFFLAVLLIFPMLAEYRILIYVLMALGVMISLYSAVAVGKADSAALAAMVFLCIVIAFPDISDPLRSTMRRVLDVFIGTAVAIAVNVFRLPRVKQPDQLFFVRTKHLVPDRYAQIPSGALIRLNYLYADGALICLMSEHAPAFFTQQMSAAQVNVPLIVMDGAAIYDIGSNRYFDVQTLPEEALGPLRDRLDQLGVSHFIYTISENKTRIYHHGKLTIEEKLVLDRLKRSPYREYLEGEAYEISEAVYYKIIGKEQKLRRLERELQSVLPQEKLRTAIRPQLEDAGICGLYIYAQSATMEQAQQRLLARMREKKPALKAVEVHPKTAYRSERDAVHLLVRLENQYEPVRLFRKKLPKTDRE